MLHPLTLTLLDLLQLLVPCPPPPRRLCPGLRSTLALLKQLRPRRLRLLHHLLLVLHLLKNTLLVLLALFGATPPPLRRPLIGPLLLLLRSLTCASTCWPSSTQPSRGSSLLSLLQ